MQKLSSLIEGFKPGKLALIGFPFDDNSSFLRGPALAPPGIRAALRSSSSNLWAERGIDLGEPDLWVDAGDLEFSSASAARDPQGITAMVCAKLFKEIAAQMLAPQMLAQPDASI